jgi:hypothetical protein
VVIGLLELHLLLLQPLAVLYQSVLDLPHHVVGYELALIVDNRVKHAFVINRLPYCALLNCPSLFLR